LNRLGRRPREIEHVYISAGPGSFTGLRIAVAMAKTMGLAIGARIVAVDTMDVIAANTREYIAESSSALAKFATILDAKRGSPPFSMPNAASSTSPRIDSSHPAAKTRNTQYAIRNTQNFCPTAL
jgi:hypothetical protein